MKYALETQNLTVGYTHKKVSTSVLSNLNLKVKIGELVCVLGRNGIGKSTLLRTLSRVQKPLNGAVLLDGIDINDINQMRLAQLLGVVLTERVNIGSLPAYKVVELGRYAYSGWTGSLSAEDQHIVDWAIHAVDAEHLVCKDMAELSDGERQRIMIARALAQEPTLLVLDEPTAFLDVPARVELMGLLRKLAREQNMSIIVSSHELELSLRSADTIWLVQSNSTLVCGAPEDIVLTGAIERAFASANISFDAEDRSFRFSNPGGYRARILGDGLNAKLACAVLEREGFEIVPENDASSLTITIEPEQPNWHSKSVTGMQISGQSFDKLAEFVRFERQKLSQKAA